MSRSYEMHVISHTHWDREWRYSFAEFRLKLIDVIDRLLEILDRRPDYKCYHLDAHTILLEDYLEIRPEMGKKLQRHIRAGRILVGPWYTLPEEFVISGESLVRNLLVGHQLASKLGRVMKIGYMPTSAGQISQLPQILGGFGIDSVLFYRGINPHDARAEFIWKGADGTRALAFHFYGGGRANFFSYGFLPTLSGGWKTPSLEDAKRFFRLMGTNYPYMNDNVDPPSHFHGDMVEPAMKYLKADAIGKATTRYLLYMDGADNGAPHPFTADFIKLANKSSGGDRYIHSNLPAYVAKVKKTVGRLQVLSGEMRHAGKSAANALYIGVLSSRLYLKQLNMRAEYNLLGRAEPWATVAWLLGHRYPKAVLDRTWKFLLANHAHDSMEACSVDPVHDDMEYRFAQCNEMSLGVLRRTLGRITAAMPLCPDKERSLIVFNHLPQARSEAVSAMVDFPDYDQQASARYNRSGRIRQVQRNRSDDLDVKTIALYDDDRPIPCHITGQDSRSIVVERLELNSGSVPTRQFYFNFYAQDIPAMGYKVFRVVPNERSTRPEASLVRRRGSMENEFLAVKINNNGSLTIRDKQTGRTFRQLHVFDDEGEAGDWSQHVPLPADRRITSSRGKAAVKVECADAFVATYRVRVRMRLPVQAAADKKSRSRKTATMELISRITLRRGARRVDIETELDHRTKDHRLRVLFPSGIKTKSSWSGGQFDVVERPVKSPVRKGWRDEQLKTHPQYHFVDVTDGKVGLGILTEGLTEYEILEDPNRTIAVTMVRAFADVIGIPAREQDTGAQCQRQIIFRYAICPHDGDYQDANLFAEARRFHLPLQIGQCGRRGGPLGDRVSFLSIEPASLILSAMKQSENGRSVILRFFNPLRKTLRGRIRFFRPIRQAWETNLNEQRLRRLGLQKPDLVQIAVGPKKIITLEITPGGR